MSGKRRPARRRPRRRAARPPRDMAKARLEVRHGQEIAQDTGGLRTLSQRHPCWATAHCGHADMITGEPGAGKLARRVRGGADGKGLN